MRLLIVEDDEFYREMLSCMLHALLPSAEVVLAEDGVQALSLYEKYGEFDGVITDYQMPKMSGVELSSYLRSSRGSALPIVLLSATPKHEIPRLDLFCAVFDKASPRSAVVRLELLIKERQCLSSP